MTTLLDLTSEMTILLAELDRIEDGEIDEQTIAMIDILVAESAAKIDATLTLCREIELRSAAQQEESERLAKRAGVGRNKVKFLKERIKFHLEATGQKRLETDHFKVCVASNGGKQSLDISVPVEQLPAACRRTEIREVADEQWIREALARGEKIDGVCLMQRGTHLRVS